MKIRLTFIDRDSLYNGCEEAAEASLEDFDGPEKDMLEKKRADEYAALFQDWVANQEIITVELDTDTNELKVLKIEEL